MFELIFSAALFKKLSRSYTVADLQGRLGGHLPWAQRVKGPQRADFRQPLCIRCMELPTLQGFRRALRPQDPPLIIHHNSL